MNNPKYAKYWACYAACRTDDLEALRRELVGLSPQQVSALCDEVRRPTRVVMCSGSHNVLCRV